MSRLAVATARVAQARTAGNVQPVNPTAKKPQAAKAFGAAINAANPGFANPAAAVAPPPAAPVSHWDSKAQLEASGQQRTYEETNNGIQAGDEQLKRRYGYDPNYKNPYSLASSLQRRHTGEATANRTLGGLNAFSGSAFNKADVTTFNFHRDEAAQREAEQSQHAQFVAEQKKAEQDYLEGIERDKLGATERWEESEPEPLAAGSGASNTRKNGAQNSAYASKKKPQAAKAFSQKKGK